MTISGTGDLYIKVNSSTLYSQVTFSLWKDSEAKYTASNSNKFDVNPNEAIDGRIQVIAPGTYYLKIEYTNTPYFGVETEPGVLNFTPRMYSRSDRTLTSGVLVCF